MSSLSAAARLSRRGQWFLLAFSLFLMGWSHEALAQCTLTAPCADTPTILGALDGDLSTARGGMSEDGSALTGQIRRDYIQYGYYWAGGSMIDLGSFGGSRDKIATQPTDLSGDGSVVVGFSYNPDGTNTAFLWDAADQVLTPLGTLGGASSDATAVSYDGSVIVGTSDINGSTWHAFRWENDAMIDLGALPGGDRSIATDISADGSVIVGSSATSGYGVDHAYRYVGGQMYDLGTLGGSQSSASAVSRDGSTVIGSANTLGDTEYHAYRWQNDHMDDLGTLGGWRSLAAVVSTDGRVVAGESYTSTGDTHAFRWEEGGTMTDLGTLGGTSSQTNAMNGDGSVIVGISKDSSGKAYAFRWTADTDMKSLNELLTSAGVDMTGIHLFTALNVSLDGQIISGNASLTGDQTRAFLVRYNDGIAGMTDPQSLVQSVDDLADSRAGAMAQQNGLAMPLLGDDKPITDESNVGVFAQAGSGQIGANTQFTASNGLTLLGGISYGYEDYDNAKIDDAVMGALAARYIMPTGSAWRPFVEGGGWYAPDADLEFSRTYMNGAGTATGVGNTHGTVSYLFGRAGVLWSLGKGEQLALSAEYGHEKLDVDGYSETFSSANPFDAVVSSGTDEMDLVKARAQWSFALAKGIDATVWAAGVYGFNRETDFTAAVVGIGTIAPVVDDTTAWAEYGARVGYALTEVATLDVFVNGVSGAADEVDTRIHGGVGLRYRY